MPSPRSGKKWRVITPSGKSVDFGATGYSDFTIHKDTSRQRNYISRHEARENWTKTGIDTAGFWSRWLLWNLPDFMESIKDIEHRFGITIDTSDIKTNSDIKTKKTYYIPTYKTSSLTTTNIEDNKELLEKYEKCLIDAAERNKKGSLKLCPEGYCTVKLTEKVYPSYWANLKASKICNGELEALPNKN